MRLSIIITLAAFLLPGFILAQYPYFQRSYNLPGQTFATSAVLNDTNIYFQVKTGLSPSSNHLYYGKLDLSGNPIDTILTNDSISYECLFINGLTYYKNHLYGVGSRFIDSEHYLSIIYKLNLDLDTVFVKEYTTNSSYKTVFFGPLAIRNDTIHTYTPSADYGQIKYYQLDTNGKVLLTRTAFLPSTLNIRYQLSSLALDDGVVFSGNGFDYPSFQITGFAFKMGYDGSLKFVKYPPNSNAGDAFAISIDKEKDSFVLFGSDLFRGTFVGQYEKTLPYIQKYNSSGSLIWEKKYFQNDTLIIFSSPSVSRYEENGDLVFGSFAILKTDSLSCAVQLFKTDSNGTLLWERHYFWDRQGTACKALMKSPFGGYYLFGYSNFDPITGHQSPFLWHIDEYGCLEPGCHLADGIKELQVPKNIQIYPNPVNDNFKIILDNISETMSLQILDNLGKVVKDVIFKAGEEIETSTLPSGMYTVLVIGKAESYLGRLVKN